MTSDQVTLCAVIAGGLCLLVYFFSAVIGPFVFKTHDAVNAVARSAKAVADPANAKAIGVDDASKLLDSISKLTDSLSKASPALVAMIGAVLFFAIAAVSSGALKSATPDKPQDGKTHASAPADTSNVGNSAANTAKS